MPRPLLNGRSALAACARVAARLACVVAMLGALAAPAQAAQGDIFTFAGTGLSGFGGDGGPATSAALRQPIAVAWLADGSVLVADYGNHRIRRISPGGQITTVAGTGAAGYSGDGGPATSARLSWPLDVEPTADGGFLIADLGNKRVRRVSPAGIITTVAGTGQGGSQGDGGPATSARLGSPTGVAVTADGGFLVADANADRVRRVSPDGTITPAVAAQLNVPVGVAALPDGGFLVAEYAGHRVRRVSAAGVITRVAGTGSCRVLRRRRPSHGSAPEQPGRRLHDRRWRVPDRRQPQRPRAQGVGRRHDLDRRRHGPGGATPATAGRRCLLSFAPPPPRSRTRTARSSSRTAKTTGCAWSKAARPPVGRLPPQRCHLRSAPCTSWCAQPRGGFYLPVVCPPTATHACRGTIRLFVRRGAAAAAAAARVVVIARGRFSVAAGDKKLVKVPLTRAGRRLLRKRRRAHGQGGRGQARRAEHRAVVGADHLQGEAQGPGARTAGAGRDRADRLHPRDRRRAGGLRRARGLRLRRARDPRASSRTGSTTRLSSRRRSRASSAASVSRAERARWLSLGAGLLCLFAGELYYTLHLSHLADPPYPSLADGLYLAFYPAGYAALVLFAPRASRQLRASLWLDGLVSSLAVAALAAALLLQPIVVEHRRGPARGGDDARLPARRRDAARVRGGAARAERLEAVAGVDADSGGTGDHGGGRRHLPLAERERHLRGGPRRSTPSGRRRHCFSVTRPGSLRRARPPASRAGACSRCPRFSRSCRSGCSSTAICSR